MSRLKAYVASSWRNERYPEVVRRLKESKLVEVYDFRNPEDKPGGFSWNEHAPDWREWSAERLRYELLQEPGRTHFARDMAALEQADVCVLVAPAGRSAHLEAGFARGAEKFLLILAVDEEPELMYGMGRIVTSVEELLDALKMVDYVIETAPGLLATEVPKRFIGKSHFERKSLWDWEGVEGRIEARKLLGEGGQGTSDD